MPQKEQNQKTRYELTVDLIKAIAWPLFAFFILFSFWKPIHLAADQLSIIINRSNTITIAGLTLKIDQSLDLYKEQPSDEVRSVLANITPNAIRILLEHVQGPTCYLTTRDDPFIKQDKVDNAELISLGLYEEYKKDETNKTAYCVHLTPVGITTQNYLYDLISAFLQSLGQPVSTSTPSN
jgi:hypothetical protein